MPADFRSWEEPPGSVQLGLNPYSSDLVWVIPSGLQFEIQFAFKPSGIPCSARPHSLPLVSREWRNGVQLQLYYYHSSIPY